MPPALSRLRAGNAPDIAFLSAAAAAVAAMHSIHFGLPQINTDEVSFFMMNLSMISAPGSALSEYFVFGGSHVGPFPVFFSKHIGALGAYASAPFHYALGSTVEAVRFYNMFVAMAISAALYVTARQMFSRVAAAVAVSAFVVLPTVVFYSRQSTMYDWIILAVALLVLYFGTRFVRGGSLWNMGAAVLLSFVIIWAYLSSAWFVLGTVAALPVCYASMRARRLRITKRAALAGAVFVLAGSAPFLAHYALITDYSYIELILVTLEDAASESPSVRLAPGTDNSAFLQNLQTRSDHLHLMLTNPAMGFWASAVRQSDGAENNPDAYDPTFAVLFLAGAAVALAEVARGGPYRRRMAGLLVLLAVIFAASTFTVTVLNPPQLGIMLPFVFLLIGGGADRATRWLARRKALERRGLRQYHAALLLVGAVVVLQAPHIYGGFEFLDGDLARDYPVPAGELGRHLSENGLTPVVMDWNTHKSLFFVLDGKSLPLRIIGEFEKFEWNQQIRDQMHTAESADLVRDDLLFVIYSYPEILDCSRDLSPPDIAASNQCAQAYFVESAAERNGLDVIVRDFDLPNGYPYYRTLQFGPAD